MAENPNNDCGCCKGLSARTLILVYNRPGLSTIRYRTGTHTRFKQSMIAGLSDPKRPALGSLKTRDEDDFSIALLDAWAAVADVLTFYQERIATESYLRTATQRESILQLSRLIGYELRPGVASSAYLAFCMETAEGAPDSTSINIGTKIQSIPGPGQLPSTFETVESITAWPSLNELKPLMTMRQEVTPSSGKVWFEGMSTGLKNGDGLLFNLKAGEEFFCQVESVKLLPEKNQTEVKIQKRVPLPPKQPKSQVKAVAYDQAARQRIFYQDMDFGKTNLGKTNLDKIDYPLSGYPLSGRVSSKSPDQSSRSSKAAGASVKVAAPQAPQYQYAYAADADKSYQVAAAKEYFAEPVKAEDVLIFNVMFPGFTTAILGGQVEPPRQGSIDLPAGVTAFRSKAYIFGHNAPRFDSLPNSMKYGDYIPEHSKDGTDKVTYHFEDGPYRYREESWVDTKLEESWAGKKLNEYKLIDNTPEKASIFLDSVYPVQKGGVIILRDGNACQPYKVDDFWDISKSDFTLTAKIRALALTTVDTSSLSEFSVRGTSVFCQGEELALARVPYDVPCVSGGSIVLDGYLYRLKKYQPIIVCGRLAMDLEDNPSSCEVAIVSDRQITPGPEGFTTISLLDSLKGKYLRETVTVYANVAPATEGETKEEVLGSGDASVPFQRFSLHSEPLTYVPSISTNGSASTLKVYVNGVQWHEVASLYGCGPKDRVFAVRRDENGKAEVKFGDGINGSRLPTGQENVRAVYRKGLGKSGNVDEGLLSLLMKVPLGIRSVKNPIAASGGADPEDLESARTNAPLDMFTLGRLVSLQDYEDFCRAFAGIGKALATWTWNGQVRGILVTVAGQGGDDVKEDSILYKNLLAEMHRAGDPTIPIELKSYQKAFFRVSASVKIDPDYQADQVLSQVRRSVLARFSFNARSFGQDVYLSEVMAAIQSVPGVMAAEVSQLYKVTARKEMKSAKCGEVLANIVLSGLVGKDSMIPASAPRSGDKHQQAAPAELLIIDPNQPFDSLGVIS